MPRACPRRAHGEGCFHRHKAESTLKKRCVLVIDPAYYPHAGFVVELGQWRCRFGGLRGTEYLESRPDVVCAEAGRHRHGKLAGAAWIEVTLTSD